MAAAIRWLLPPPVAVAGAAPPDSAAHGPVIVEIQQALTSARERFHAMDEASVIAHNPAGGFEGESARSLDERRAKQTPLPRRGGYVAVPRLRPRPVRSPGPARRRGRGAGIARIVEGG